MKKLLLKFVRRFFNPDLAYTDALTKQWVDGLVRLIVDIIFYGFVGWLFILSILSIFPINWINIGPGAWHLLNIFQIGFILWFLKGTLNYLRRGKK